MNIYTFVFLGLTLTSVLAQNPILYSQKAVYEGNSKDKNVPYSAFTPFNGKSSENVKLKNFIDNRREENLRSSPNNYEVTVKGLGDKKSYAMNINNDDLISYTTKDKAEVETTKDEAEATKDEVETTKDEAEATKDEAEAETTKDEAEAEADPTDNSLSDISIPSLVAMLFIASLKVMLNYGKILVVKVSNFVVAAYGVFYRYIKSKKV
jgi:hypothetical protein